MEKLVPNLKENHWYVITGGPSPGKTTIIKLLEARGYKVAHELAREFIDAEISKGKTIKEVRSNELVFQRQILDLKIKHEQKLPKDVVVFLDRGIPGTIAYYQFLNIPVDDFLKRAVASSNYRKVFLLDLLPFVSDYARVENENDQQRIHELILKAYQGLKYQVIPVPVLPVNQRLNYILQHIDLK